MGTEYISLISALIGALIGAGASICAMWIQTNAQDRRMRIKQVMDFALEDYKHSVQLKLDSRKEGQVVAVPPVVTYLHYHMGLMELLDKNDVTPESLTALKKKNKEISEAIKAYGR